MDITDLPFNRLIGLARSDREGSVLMLPSDVRYTNHLGIVHAAALLALAENTSGEYLIREFPDLGFEVRPIVRRLEAKFRKPAQGAIFSSWKVPPETKAEIRTVLATKGRAFFTIQVNLHDAAGAHVAVVNVEWFAARKE